MSHEPDPVVDTASRLAARLDEGTGSLAAVLAQLREVRGEQRKSWKAIFGLGALYAIDVALVIGALTFGWHVSEVSACQAKQNDAFRAASAQSRAAATAQNDRAIQKIDHELAMLDIVTDPTSSPTGRLAAVNGYKQAARASKDALVTSNQTRVDNPLPTGNCS